MAYMLGVDLGTTFSAAATIDEDGVPTMVGLGNRALQIPSVVFVRDDGSMLVGEQAEREATTDPTRVVREFKRRVGDDIPIVVAGQPYSPELMMAQVLRWVVDQTSERRGEAPSQVTPDSTPAAWTRDYKVGKLHEAARTSPMSWTVSLDLPGAGRVAAMNYASQHRVEVGDRICVYDLGGGTFDVCVLAKTATGFEDPGQSQRRRPARRDRLRQGDHRQGESRPAGFVRDSGPGRSWVLPLPTGLRRGQRVAVGATSRPSFRVSLAGTTTSVRLTRAEFEAMIDPLLTETIKQDRAFEFELRRRAGRRPAEHRAHRRVDPRIPMVTEKLTTAFHCPVARNTHPKHADVVAGRRLGRLARESRSHSGCRRRSRGHPGSRVRAGPLTDDG